MQDIRTMILREITLNVQIAHYKCQKEYHTLDLNTPHGPSHRFLESIILYIPVLKNIQYPTNMVQTPEFTPVTIQDRHDGYWIDKFHFHENDKAPGLVVYVSSAVAMCCKLTKSKVGAQFGQDWVSRKSTEKGWQRCQWQRCQVGSCVSICRKQ